MRFAAQDRLKENTDGSKKVVLAEAYKGCNIINMRPAIFRKSEGHYGRHGRLLSEVDVNNYTMIWGDCLMENIGSKIIHEKSHAVLKGKAKSDTSRCDLY